MQQTVKNYRKLIYLKLNQKILTNEKDSFFITPGFSLLL